MRFKQKLFFLLIVAIPHLLFSQERIKLDINLVEKKLPFGLTKTVSKHKPIVSLALSDAGAGRHSH